MASGPYAYIFYLYKPYIYTIVLVILSTKSKTNPHNPLFR